MDRGSAAQLDNDGSHKAPSDAELEKTVELLIRWH